MRNICALILLTLVTVSAAAAAPFQDYDEVSASIFVYNRIGEDAYPQSNIRLDQFESHIQELAAGPYHVASLDEVVSAFNNHTPLPHNTVVLTFDGGFRSIKTAAIPILEKHNMPYAVFVVPGLLGGDNDQYLNWADLKDIAKSKHATIGLHPVSYTRTYALDDTEMERQINSAIGDYTTHMDERPRFFAYPFGEYSTALQNTVKDKGFDAALAQNSGVAWYGSDIFALPRFTMTESYGDLERFRMAAQALPIPVTAIAPEDPYTSDNPPSIGFTLHSDFTNNTDALDCFANDQDKPELQMLGEARIEIRLEQPFTDDRARVNCTMPAGTNEDGEQLWRWTGFLFSLKEETSN